MHDRESAMGLSQTDQAKLKGDILRDQLRRVYSKKTIALEKKVDKTSILRSSQKSLG